MLQSEPLITAVAHHAGYQSELPLFDDGPTYEELVVAQAAVGSTTPPALTLDDVVFVRRCCMIAVRSCSTSARYGQADYTACSIVAVEPLAVIASGETQVSVEQIGEAAAYAALLALNRQRLLEALLTI